jgi:heterotetrameric sarcosine oxidase delta subunit
MIRIDCPNCGPRNALEFRYGGEYNPRPANPMDTSDDAWADYVFMRDNRSGVQKEWWYHRAGCQLWFLAERHTRNNEVLTTRLWEHTSRSDNQE